MYSNLLKVFVYPTSITLFSLTYETSSPWRGCSEAVLGPYSLPISSFPSVLSVTHSSPSHYFLSSFHLTSRPFIFILPPLWPYHTISFHGTYTIPRFVSVKFIASKFQELSYFTRTVLWWSAVIFLRSPTCKQ